MLFGTIVFVIETNDMTLVMMVHSRTALATGSFSGPALSKLAAKYSIPANIWRHGIHAFLELLRHRLSNLLDHMLPFIYIAYSMMALLFKFSDRYLGFPRDLQRHGHW